MKYFDDAPLLTIPGFTHPVTDMFVKFESSIGPTMLTMLSSRYLEDIVPLIDYRPSTVQRGKERSEPEKDSLAVQRLDERRINAISRSGRLDYQVSVIFPFQAENRNCLLKQT